ncbi:MAG: hypothetical protein DMG48_09500 [Acidobacteria bacterium]|nr:MAG: hypothetical protein DMG48_09500 [Acidobacteriota bacterium]
MGFAKKSPELIPISFDQDARPPQIGAKSVQFSRTSATFTPLIQLFTPPDPDNRLAFFSVVST